MDIKKFIDQVVDEGIVVVKKDYTRSDQKQKRDGSIAGFEACRDKTIEELKDLLEITEIAVCDARSNKDNYWWYRCYQAEVEWVCNCLSSILVNEGQEPLVTPTVRGAIQAAKIVGVKA